MVKVRINVKEGRKSDYYCNYCDLQTLLVHEIPWAYSVRREGWACDYYDIDGVIISTGYTPHGKKRIPYEICRKYEKLSDGKDREQCRILFHQMIKEI
jgi:hypothetical protein